METKTLEKAICEDIHQKLGLVKLPTFLKEEIKLIFGRLNYYKISNIDKNMDLFLSHLNSLSQIYFKEIEKSFAKENLRPKRNIKRYSEKINQELKSLEQIDLKYMNYYLPKIYIRKFGLIYLSTQNDVSFEEYLKKQISILSGVRFRILTMINLSILEYANSPSRITLFQRIMKEI